MAEIGTLTGADILSKYVRDYGFGSETGIELPGEGAGILYNPEDMSKLDVGNHVYRSRYCGYTITNGSRFWCTF